MMDMWFAGADVYKVTNFCNKWSENDASLKEISRGRIKHREEVAGKKHWKSQIKRGKRLWMQNHYDTVIIHQLISILITKLKLET